MLRTVLAAALLAAVAVAGTSGTYRRNNLTVEVDVQGSVHGDVEVRARQPGGDWGRAVTGTQDIGEDCADCWESPEFSDGSGNRYRFKQGKLQHQGSDGVWRVLKQETFEC